MSRPLRRRGRVTALAASFTLLLSGAAALATPAGAEEPATPAAPTGSPLTLWAPSRVVAYSYDNYLYSDLGLKVIAQGAPFELWSTRASYDEPITTVWRSPGGDVALPASVMPTFAQLQRFVRLDVTRVGTDTTRTSRFAACLGGGWEQGSERVRPEAPATSPYPHNCYYNPFSLGAVQGVQEGWATPVFGEGAPLQLKPGKYDVTARITPAYADVIGISATDATRTYRLVVKPEGNFRPATRRASTPEPAAQEPGAASAGVVAGTRPDLRSLPAFGMNISRNGNFLRFFATVWNGGDSPLVVDGFRRADEEVMDAYQYFFDGDGNQTGYEKVGAMHWDARSTHQHWHFEDFARYALLDASKVEAVRSKKEAFCLAPTDAVDLTVPNAAWNVENSDLATACGDSSALSIREVLASGWGDTYAQFRAGQSFDLRGLPNGTYYVAVIANPDGNLIEGDTDNNTSLRKVRIGGRPGARTVRVPQVGLIEEFGEFFRH
jgi:hypothetical protein